MYYIGIDVGGTSLKAGLVDEDAKIVYKESVPTCTEKGYKQIIKDMADLVSKVIKNGKVEQKSIKSIGVGIPGAIDSKGGNVIFACNINFRNVPLREEMQKYIDLPIFIENDANCAALAESIDGAAKGIDHSITITLGTGIGGGVVIDKKIYSGFNGTASELGHMVIMVDGESCTCGRRGCWETYASATAIIRQTKKAAQENPDSLINKLIGGNLSKIDAKTAFDAAKQGDEVGIRVVNQYIKYIAEGLLNIINIFQPEILVIGGGVCKEGEYLLKPLRELVSAGIYTKGEIPEPQIKVAEMGNDAGIIGAAMLGKSFD